MLPVRIAECPTCQFALRYDGSCLFGLNDSGREMWDKHGPPTCPICARSKMQERATVVQLDPLALPEAK